MRVGWISDLHADQNRGVGELVAERVRVLRPDVMIVAGDVSHHSAAVEDTLGTIATAARQSGARATFFVAGNHDLWVEPKGDVDSRTKLTRYLAEACARAGATMLGAGDGQPAIVLGPDGRPVAFCGVPGWYDYSLRSAWLDAEVTLDDYARKRRGRLVWQDLHYFRWPRAGGGSGAPWEDDPGVARLMEGDLAEQLGRVRGRVPRAVVVTHFLPFKALATERGHPVWDFLNGYMGSAGLGEIIARTPEVVLAVSGHTHIRREARVPRAGGGWILAATSPLGYPRERACTLAERVADRLRVVDLDALVAGAGVAAGASESPRASES